MLDSQLSIKIEAISQLLATILAIFLWRFSVNPSIVRRFSKNFRVIISSFEILRTLLIAFWDATTSMKQLLRSCERSSLATFSPGINYTVTVKLLSSKIHTMIRQRLAISHVSWQYQLKQPPFIIWQLKFWSILRYQFTPCRPLSPFPSNSWLFNISGFTHHALFNLKFYSVPVLRCPLKPLRNLWEKRSCHCNRLVRWKCTVASYFLVTLLMA